MQAPIYPVTPLRQIAIILAHCILRIQNKRLTGLRAAREQLQVDSAELAEMLGVSLPTLRSWIAPTSSKMHRSMPRTAQLLLERILAEAEKSDHRN